MSDDDYAAFYGGGPFWRFVRLFRPGAKRLCLLAMGCFFTANHDATACAAIGNNPNTADGACGINYDASFISIDDYRA